MTTALVFLAGWITGAASLAFAIGAAFKWLDGWDVRHPDLEDDDVPVYVPQEWLA